jgi:hypothetical protein
MQQTIKSIWMNSFMVTFYIFALTTGSAVHAKGKIPTSEENGYTIYKPTILTENIKKDQIFEDMHLTSEINKLLANDTQVKHLSLSIQSSNR